MKRYYLLLLSFAFLVVSCGSPSLPPQSGISQVKFINEIPSGSPNAVGVDDKGNIYTAQSGGTILVTDNAGKKLFEIATQTKSGERVLKNPASIDVYKDKIYVADKSLNKVVIFSTSGKYLESFGDKGDGHKEFRNPMGIDVYKGVIYVADTGNNRIQVYGENGVYLHTIDGTVAPNKKSKRVQKKTGDASLWQISGPIDVAVDVYGDVYVVNGGTGKVKFYDNRGAFLGVLPDVDNAVSIDKTTDGVMVADLESFCIKKFSLDNKLLFSFGSKGEGRTQFKSIDKITVDNEGNVLVADSRKGMVQVFLPNIDGAVAPWEWASPPNSVLWLDKYDFLAANTAWDGKDTLYAIDKKKDTIVPIKAGVVGKPIKINKCEPVALAVDGSGFIWVLDKKKKRVLKLKDDGAVVMEFGSSGRGAGQFKKPTDIAISSAGIIYVADRGNSMIQAFSRDGMFLNALRETTKKNRNLEEPIAVAIAPDDTLCVLDGDTFSVTIYSAEGKPLADFGKEGKGPGEFDKPVDLFTNGTEIFIIDADSNFIKVFSREGKFARRIGVKGKEKGDFDEPSSITRMGESVFAVSEDDNKRIQILQNIYYPQKPQNITAQAGMRVVSLKWEKSPENFVTKYNIYRSEKPDSDFNKVDISEKSEFADSTVEPDKEIFYRVTAVAENGTESVPSDLVKGLPTKYTPSMPTDLAAVADAWSVKLNWKESDEALISKYNIYRIKDEQPFLVGTSNTSSYIDNGLAADNTYTYQVSAVSSDDIESEKASVNTFTLKSSKPPLSIDVVELHNIFSNTYKIYEKDGVGRVQITNNTGISLSKIKVAFAIKEFMDFPTEMVIDDLPPGESHEFVLKAVFNNNILSVTEDTPVQTEIKASYYENEEQKNINKNLPINIYEKHRMSWDEKGRFASFITPKDALLLNFVRSIITQYTEADDTIQRASALFDGLGAYGVTYVQDPSNPYQKTSGIVDFVDYIQYPRETLQRKSGDCDDLVALYAAGLESLGIRTLAIEVPGHMLMMFATGIEAADGGETMNDMFVIKDNMLWVPVETTLVGNSFLKAWEKGSGTYYATKSENLTFLNIRKSWNTYKPASLPVADWTPPALKRAKIEEKFQGDFSSIRKISIQARMKKYLDAFRKNKNDENALQQIGIISAKAGEHKDATKAFAQLIGINAKNAGAHNNLGNVYFMQEAYDKAMASYEAAAKLDPSDALVWVNLARCYQNLKMDGKAKEAFKKAVDLDQDVNKQFRAMSLQLLNAF